MPETCLRYRRSLNSIVRHRNQRRSVLSWLVSSVSGRFAAALLPAAAQQAVPLPSDVCTATARNVTSCRGRPSPSFPSIDRRAPAAVSRAALPQACVDQVCRCGSCIPRRFRSATRLPRRATCQASRCAVRPGSSATARLVTALFARRDAGIERVPLDPDLTCAARYSSYRRVFASHPGFMPA